MNGLALYDAGYQDLVLIRPGSKVPAHEGWLHARPSREQVAAWEGNIGLIAQEFPGIDLDLHDEALSTEIVKLTLRILGPAPCRLSHRPASKLLPYHATTPFRKKVLTLPDGKGKVEVLGVGRQYLVDGIHPEGTPYRWARTPLWKIPPVRLTEVTEEQVDAYLDTLQKQFGGFVGRSSAAAENVVPPEELLAPSLEHVHNIVNQMPNCDAFLRSALPEHACSRDYWVAMGHIIKGAAGAAGEQLFLDWTARYEDGPIDLDDAAVVYHGLKPERYGWPTLDRIAREHLDKIAAEDEFEAEDAPPPEPEPAAEPMFKWAVQYSDEYVADRMAAKLRGSMCYAGKAWMIWDGHCWTMDSSRLSLEAERLLRVEMRAFAERVLDNSLTAASADEAQQMRNRAKSLMSRNGMRTILDHLCVPLAADIDDFNADGMALNTPMGLVDLHTGACRVTTSQDLVSRMTAAAPAHTGAPHWAAFLDHLTAGDVDLAAFLQRYMGYCLTGRMDEKVFVFAWGSNHDTGKSTFVKAVAHAMGTYAQSEDVDLLLGGMSENRRGQGLARLFGARLLTSTEPSAGRKWDDETIKKITGRDMVTARYLFKEPFDYEPQFKILLAGNHEPELRAVDKAMLRRLLIAPMNNPVTPEEMDGNLDQKLYREAPAILQWMIDGCLEWQRGGLRPPTAVMVATEEYRDAEDLLAQWLSECCDCDSRHKAATTELYMSWREWCGRRGRRPEGATAFARMLAARGTEWKLERYRTAVERGYHGLRLRPRVALGTDFDD